MQVILLERVAKLGQMGDEVKVKGGFARNYLLPNGKALRATKENLKRFENERAQLEAHNLERRTEAESVAESLNNKVFVVIRQAGETGQLYGSVSTRDIAETLTDNGFTVARNQVNLQASIKVIGLHSVVIVLHPEVEVTVQLNVARSEEEAERQAQGEILIGRDEQGFEFANQDQEKSDEEDGEKKAEGDVEQNTGETKDSKANENESMSKQTKSASDSEEITDSKADSESNSSMQDGNSEKVANAESKSNTDESHVADSDAEPETNTDAGDGESDSKVGNEDSSEKSNDESDASEPSEDSGTETEENTKS